MYIVESKRDFLENAPLFQNGGEFMAVVTLYKKEERIGRDLVAVSFERPRSNRDDLIELSLGHSMITCSGDEVNERRITEIGDSVFKYLQDAAKRGDFTSVHCKLEGAIELAVQRVPGPLVPKLSSLAQIFDQVIRGEKKAPECCIKISEKEALNNWKIQLPRTIRIFGPRERMSNEDIKSVLVAFSDYSKVGCELAKARPGTLEDQQWGRIRKMLAEELMRVYEKTGLSIEL